MSKELTLTDIQQRSLLGHAIQDGTVLSALRTLGVIFERGNDPAIFKRLCDLADRFQGQPSVDELRSFLAQGQTLPQATSFQKTLDEALELAGKVRIETITPDLKRWGEQQVFKNGIEEAADLYNKSFELFNQNGGASGQREHDEAKAKILELVGNLDRVGHAVSGARFEVMPVRLKGEARERVARHNRTIPTGVSYLDDATGGGLGPKDLWVVSGQTGFGKTQTLLAIAQSAGKIGKKAVFFALEAEELELERRVKWSLLLRLYNDRYPGNRDFLDGAAWLKGRLDVVKRLYPFEEQAQAELDERLKNVHTFYRGFGKYTPQDLKRDIFTQARDADLILVDHLGYIDLDGNNENRAVTDMMHELADLAMTGSGRPIVVAAQTRKGDGKTARKFAPLIPAMEDINGSKAIVTCATNVVMIARVNESVGLYAGATDDGKLVDPVTFVKNPTLVQLQKCRVADRIRQAAVMQYEPALGSYAEDYGIGKFKSGDTVWEPQFPPEWARHAKMKVNTIDPQGD